MVNITITNQFGDCQPPTLSLTNISDDITVSSIGILIENQFKCLKAEYDDQRDPAEKFVLYCGTKMLEGEHQVGDYNTAGLPELTFYLYERRFIKVSVKVVRYFMCCGVFFNPALNSLFARKLSIELLDQETVLKLKNTILEQMENYTNRSGEHLSLETLRLVNQRFLVEDNLQQLKDINEGKDLSLTLLVPCQYRARSKASSAGSGKAAGETEAEAEDDGSASSKSVGDIPVVTVSAPGDSAETALNEAAADADSVSGDAKN
ncbi:ubiquitin, putative [Babesia caballi]|uniref:Ubiquitin, putative n=1 Tax=Babesia caballi TaxID=5871 RepID=A0AAV4LL42_BABCB|nr:ubiquitin, putative [Babesia caballi]